MMSNLPQDLLEEILSRIPATSLIRIRSTCKRWNTLLRDLGFINKHFYQAAKQHCFLVLKDNKICSMSLNTDIVPLSMEFKGTYGLKNTYTSSEEVDFESVFHCDGLLLCTTMDNRLVVWNPCLGVTRWIQPKTGYKISRFALGYEKKKNFRSYKILIGWSCYEPNSSPNGFEVYEIRSDSWRVLDDDVIINNFFTLIGPSLKGNTYSLASDKHERYLVCFDFTIERFKRLCLPPTGNHGSILLSVVREEEEEQLSIIHLISGTPTLHIWVTNKIETDTQVPLLWSKSFTVDFPIFGYYFLSFLSLLIVKGNKVINVWYKANSAGPSIKMVYIKDDGDYSEFPIVDSRNLSRCPFIFNYVPSLAQI